MHMVNISLQTLFGLGMSSLGRTRQQLVTTRTLPEHTLVLRFFIDGGGKLRRCARAKRYCVRCFIRSSWNSVRATENVAIAMGTYVAASGEFSSAVWPVGHRIRSVQRCIREECNGVRDFSNVAGRLVIAGGNSGALGGFVSVSGAYSSALGSLSAASGDYNIAVGKGSTAVVVSPVAVVRAILSVRPRVWDPL